MSPRLFRPAMLLAVAGFIASCAPGPPAATPPPLKRPLVLGLHVLLENISAAETLIREIPALAKRGVNLLIAEVNYNYAYATHPELRGEDPIPEETVKRIVRLCRTRGIRLIPQFQSLGHQSWAAKTFSLLAKYPQLD